MNDQPPLAEATKSFDADAFAKNLARVLESAGKALSAYLKPRESGELKDQTAEDLAQVVKTFHTVANYWLADPSRATELQTRLGKAYLNLWENAARRLAGEQTAPTIEAAPRDKRFKDPEWNSNQFFDFLKQAYLLTTKCAYELVQEADGVDPHTR